MNPDQITEYIQYSPFHYCNYLTCQTKPESKAPVNKRAGRDTAAAVQLSYLHFPILFHQRPQLNPGHERKN